MLDERPCDQGHEPIFESENVFSLSFLPRVHCVAIMVVTTRAASKEKSKSKSKEPESSESETELTELPSDDDELEDIGPIPDADEGEDPTVYVRRCLAPILLTVKSIPDLRSRLEAVEARTVQIMDDQKATKAAIETIKANVAAIKNRPVEVATEATAPASTRRTSTRDTATAHVDDRPKKVSRPEHIGRWNWKEFTLAGRGFYKILQAPEEDEKFMSFLREPAEVAAGQPALKYRLTAMRILGTTRQAYDRITALAASRSVDAKAWRALVQGASELMVLKELLALHCVLRARHGITPLRVWLALGEVDEEEAGQMTREALERIQPHSAISTEVLRLAKNEVWARSLMNRPGLINGEEYTNADAYHDACNLAQSGEVASLASLTDRIVAETHRSLTEVGTHRSTRVSGFGDSAPRPRPTTRVAESPMRQWLTNRCYRCFELGHRHTACVTKNCHPMYRPNDPGFVARMISKGVFPAPKTQDVSV